MNRPAIASFLACLFLLSIPARIASMDEPAKPFDVDSLTHIPRVVRDVMKSVQSGWNGVVNAAQNFKKEQEWAKWQNTVVVAHPKVPVALYKKDLIELPLFATDIALAYWFFYTFKKNRINHIFTEFITHADWYLEKFEFIDQLIKANAEIVQAVDKSFSEKIQVIEANKAILTKAWEEIALRHHYLGYNPFKKEIIGPFIATLTGHQLTSILQGKLLVKQSFTPEALFAYNADGTPFNLDTMWQPSTDQVNQAIQDTTYRPPARYTIQYRDNNGHYTQDSDVNPLTAAQYPCNGKTPTQIISEVPGIQAVYTAHGYSAKANFSQWSDSGFIARQQPLTAEETKEVAERAAQGGNTLTKEFLKGLFFWHGAPISVSSFIKSFFIANPNAPTIDYGPPIERMLKNFGNGLQYVIPEGTFTKAWYHLLGLPSWFYPMLHNPVSQKIIAGSMMLGGLYVANATYQSEWMRTLGTEYSEVQTLLIAYKSVAHLPDTDSDKKMVLRNLKKLIARGNQVTGNGIRSAVNEFFTIKFFGRLSVQSKLNAWIITLTNLFLLAKLRHLRTAWPKIKLAQKAGWFDLNAFMASPVGPLIIIEGTYIGLVWSVFALSCASIVAEDIKNMYTSVKQRFAKPTSEKIEEESQAPDQEINEPMEESHETS